MLQPFRPPTAAQAAEAALYGELPAMPGLPPAAATQADVDAFLAGLPPQGAAHTADFAEFEGIYAQRQGLPPPPALAAQGRAAAAPMLQVRAGPVWIAACAAEGWPAPAADMWWA